MDNQAKGATVRVCFDGFTFPFSMAHDACQAAVLAVALGATYAVVLVNGEIHETVRADVGSSEDHWDDYPHHSPTDDEMRQLAAEDAAYE